MDRKKLLEQAKFQATPTRGISMEEQTLISGLPKLDVVTTALNEAEVVRQLKTSVYFALGRRNLPGKDLRNAIISLIGW